MERWSVLLLASVIIFSLVGIVLFFIFNDKPQEELAIEGKTATQILADTKPVGENWTINETEDIVFFNDSNVYAQASPVVLNGDGYVEFEFVSKAYSGNVDFAWAFNTTYVEPMSAELFNPHWDNNTRSYTCNTGIFNYTLNPRFAWCYQNVLNNETGQNYSEIIFASPFEWGNLSTSTVYWNDSYINNWTNIGNNFNVVDYTYQDVNKFYLLSNQPINANQTYRLRTWIDSSGLQQQTKYWFAFKPSAETIQQAISNGHLYALDPWIDPAVDNAGLVAFYHFNTINVTENKRTNLETRFHLTNVSSATGVNGSWTSLGKFQGAWNTSDSPAYFLGIGNDTLGNNWTSFPNITVTMWVMANDSTNDNTNQKNIWFFGDNEVYLTFSRRNGTASNNLGYCLQSTFAGATNAINCTGVVENGTQWRHLALVYSNDSQNLTFFVDGLYVGNMRQAGRQTDTDHATERDTFRIFGSGGVQTASSFIFDSITVWNITMNISDIQSIMGSANSSGSVTIHSLAPTNNTITVSNTFNFSVNSQASGGYNLSNATLSIWYNNGTLLNQTSKTAVGIINSTNISLYNLNLGTYVWGFLVCANDSTSSTCATSINSTFTRSIEVNSSAPLGSAETVTEVFQQNITAPSGLTVSSANLLFNGTSYSGTTSNVAADNWTLTRTLVIPIGDGLKNFFWLVNFNDGSQVNTTTNTVQVNRTLLGQNNATFPYYVNFTFANEATSAALAGLIDASSWTFWIGGGGTTTKSFTYSNSSANYGYGFGLNPSQYNFTTDLTLSYSASGYPIRTYTLDDRHFTIGATNTTLYLLASADGIYSSIQVVETTGISISGVFVTIERQVNGVYQIVGSGNTDDSGTVTFWVNPNFAHRVTASKTGYATAQVTITPSQSIYTLALSKTDQGATYDDEAGGLKYVIYPSVGTISRGSHSFNLTVRGNLNLQGCRLEIVNSTNVSQMFSNITSPGLTNSSYCFYTQFFFSFNSELFLSCAI